MKVHGIDRTSIVRTNDLPPRTPGPKNKSDDFKHTLDRVLSSKTELKFSGHARDRLHNRGVPLDGEIVNRLDKAVLAAGKKGADQSLVLLDEMAFLVSIKNKTVITAMETNNMKEGVFTKIDSAVIG